MDAMLGSLARKLRAFGFDALYFSSGDDGTLLSVAETEERVLLTADRGLAEKAKRTGLPSFLLTGQTDGERLASLAALAKEAGLSLVRGDPLCSICGAVLRAVPRREALRSVPGAFRHRSFSQCSKCGQVYWRGSHWKKLRRLEKLLRDSAGDID